MTEITRFDFDTRVHHGVVHNGTAYLTGQVAEPGQSAADQTREVLAKIDDLLAKAHEKAPISSLLSIDDVGAATAMLATDAAKLMTGQTLFVDGGYHIID